MNGINEVAIAAVRSERATSIALASIALAVASAVAAVAAAAADMQAVRRVVFQNAQSTLQLAPGPGGLAIVIPDVPAAPPPVKNPSANRITEAAPPSRNSNPI
jgi:hypothetical protein